MAKSDKVSVYIRRPGTRERERATKSVATDTTFCLRYMRSAKRRWETLENVTSFAQAQKLAIDRSVDLATGRADTVPETRPEPSTPKPSVKTGAVPLDKAIDVYNANCASRSGKTISGYAATIGLSKQSRRSYRSSWPLGNICSRVDRPLFSPSSPPSTRE